MSYAIIQLAGKQYKVSPQDKLVVDRLETNPGEKITVTDVLFVGEGENAQIGTPLVKGAKVVLTVDSHSRAKKIRVAKYKSKSRYRRNYGHRQHQTTVIVESITA